MRTAFFLNYFFAFLRILLLTYCLFSAIHDIVFQAYSPLGSGDRPWLKKGPPISGVELLQDPELKAVAEKHKKSVAQCVLRWHVQMGGCAVPKSQNAVSHQGKYGNF